MPPEGRLGEQACAGLATVAAIALLMGAEEHTVHGQRPAEHVVHQVQLPAWEQAAGDLVCVPSGWVHRVVNHAPTVAFSENFINASNVDVVLAGPDGPPDDFRRLVKFVRALGA